VANALLDAYDNNHDPKCLAMAIEASEYIINRLYWTDGDFSAGFSYPLPSIRTHIHNSNIVGAALLCRVSQYTKDKMLLGPALRVARYSVAKQQDDGSWFYGESPKQRWIDNFHTGYNLLGLRGINIYGETSEFDFHIQHGFDFYKKNFFMHNVVPKYFHNRTYPIDIHCVAQSLITLSAFNDLNDDNIKLIFSVLRWALTHMWDDRGYFYYQVLPSYTNKISYMRWSQAWMLLALSTVLEGVSNANQKSLNQDGLGYSKLPRSTIKSPSGDNIVTK
jgi:hypothetical protein